MNSWLFINATVPELMFPKKIAPRRVKLPTAPSATAITEQNIPPANVRIITAKLRPTKIVRFQFAGIRGFHIVRRLR